MHPDPRLALALLLALPGCQREAREPAPPPEATQPVQSQPTARAEPAERSTEVQTDELLGTWRVVAVVPDTGSAFAHDDPRVMGALMDLYAEKLGWSYLPAKDFAPADVCLGPVAGLATRAADAQAIRESLAPARAAAKVADPLLSRPHRWLCGDGGEWGGEAGFQVLGADDMAMRWPGGISLLLQRIQRASSDPPDLPPIGASEGPAGAR